MAAWAAVAGLLLVVVAIRLSLLYEPYTFLIGDCPYYAQTAISLVVDGDLDLRNDLKGGLEPHQKQVSLGARGEWYPKHPILMPLMAAPLLPLAGMRAFLLFNVLVLVGLALVLYEIGSLAARPWAAAAGTLATILGSFLILYDYNFSPDLFACLLLALSVYGAMRGSAVASGLLAGLAALARTSNLFVIPLILSYVAWKGRGRATLLFLAAVAPPLLAQAALNHGMFGSPLTSPYMRILTLEEGEPVLRSHMSDFDNPLLDGILGQLADPEKGLLFTAPVLLLALPGFVIWLRRRPDQALLCLGVAELLFLLFSRYRWWPTSHVGNRFLMPVVALGAPAVACLFDWVADRILSRRPRRASPPAG